MADLLVGGRVGVGGRARMVGWRRVAKGGNRGGGFIVARGWVGVVRRPVHRGDPSGGGVSGCTWRPRVRAGGGSRAGHRLTTAHGHDAKGRGRRPMCTRT
jgi:hypothetical protein